MTMLEFRKAQVRHSTGYESIDPAIDVALALKNAISEEGRSGPSLFFLVSQLRVAVRSGLVRKDDVKVPLSWYVEKRLSRHKQLLLDYMKDSAAPETIDFFAPLDAWTRCSSG